MTTRMHHFPVVKLMNCRGIGFMILTGIDDETDVRALPDYAAQSLTERRRVMNAADHLVIHQHYGHHGQNLIKANEKACLYFWRKPVEITMIDPALLMSFNVRFDIGMGCPVPGLNNQPFGVDFRALQQPA